MKVLQCDTGQTFAVSLDDFRRCIHIYKQNQLDSIVSAPVPIIDLCVSSSCDDQCTLWVLYILTSDNRLYYVEESQVNAYRASQNLLLKQKSHGNQEIFNELLGDGPASDLLEFYPASEPVYQISSKELVLDLRQDVVGESSVCSAGPDVISVAVGYGIVVIASDQCDHYQVEVYLEATVHSGFNTKTPLQTYILNKQPQALRDELTCRPEMSPSFSLDKEEKHLSLHLVASSQMTTTPSSSILVIPSDLFQALCGFELSLLNSPLLLISPPEGCVFYTPIKNMDTEQMHGSCKLFCHTYYAVVGICKIDISTAVIGDLFGEDVPAADRQTGLVVSTKNGKGLLTTVKRKDKQACQSRTAYGLEFVDFALSGPVLDIDTHNNKIYHSSGADVLETTLEATPGQQCHITTKCVSLRYGRIRELVCFNNPRQTEGGSCELLLKTYDQSLKTIQPENRHTMRRYRLGGGQTIRDLLHSIDTCNRQAVLLQEIQSNLSDFLKQLNIAAFLYTKNIRNCTTEFPFIFSYEISKCHVGRMADSDWLIICHMTNKSDLNLSNDWTVLVTLSDAFQENLGMVSYSFALPSGVNPREKIVFHIAPPPTYRSLFKPLFLKTSLVLHASSHIISPDMPQLTVLVDETTIDILTGMLREEDTTLNSVTHLTPKVSVHQLVTEIADSRPVSVCLMNKESDKNLSNCLLEVKLPRRVMEVIGGTETDFDKNAVLSTLLKQGKSSMITVNGHKLQLTVNDQTLTIQSNQASVAIATRLALITRFRKCTSMKACHIQPDFMRRVKLQDLDEYLRDLQMWDENISRDIIIYRDKAVHMYQNLRSNNFL